MTINWTPTLRPSQQPRYLALVDALAGDIAAGRLKQDDALPTQRELADRLKVALGTVTRAYLEAEKRGLIRAQGRRGTFVGTSSSSGLNSLKTLLKTDDRLIDFGMNHPAYRLNPDLASTLKILAKQHDLSALLRYPPAEGAWRYRLDGVKWIHALGLKVEPESVLLAAGAQQGLSLIVSAITKPGDLILTEALTYPGIKAVAEFFHLKMMGIAMDQEGILPESLEAVCRRRKPKVLFCMPDLHNPTSAVLVLKRRESLAALARKYDLWIIEDAIHRPFLDDQLPTMAQLAPENTFLLASASKTVAAGLRVAFIYTPERAMSRLRQAVTALTLYPSPLPFEIFNFWMENGITEATIRERKKEIEKCNKLARKILFGQNIQGHARSNYFWLTLPHGLDRSRFTLDANRCGVMVSPADVFSVEGQPCPDAIRICLGAAQDPSVLQKGLKIILEILQGKKTSTNETI